MPQIFLFALALLIIPHQASAVELGIVTGSEKGTYYEIGQNISKLVARRGINLTVDSAKGSFENILAIYKKPDVELGIAQSDALKWYLERKVDVDESLKQAAKKVKIVFPLYNEEVHLLANKQINTFSDLEGKVVSIGENGSGSYLTGSLLLTDMRVKIKQFDEIKAIQALLDGDIDAMFYVAGYPVKLFQNIAPNGNLHLVPITPSDNYPIISTIPAQTYPWQTEKVSTIAVKAVLITYDYNGAKCKNVGRLAKIMYNNLDWLKRKGHEKWKTVDFDDFQFDPQRIWEQSVCVKRQVK
ncbi:MAG: TAXI family TRAP transporter solute-binding subunit [Candidatus Parabeggiatoa sp.]|nr:TAXI family TRAP transporter solute-binding subunit [Candidatus Parabeggiatoa sp.]